MDVHDVDSWRLSRLDADPDGRDGLFLVTADLHNHSHFSDGAGDPEQAFHQMREAGLDVAALTDHSSIPCEVLAGLDSGDCPHTYPDRLALAMARTGPRSIDEQAWRRTGELADAHDVPGRFTAIRGFEWTEPWLGHVNVWFSDTFAPVTTPGSLSGLFDFLEVAEATSLFGYNHPGRELGMLAEFGMPQDAGRATELGRRMVALEAFNRREDFLFQLREGRSFAPLVECLDAGWHPAMVGASDEHGAHYALAGKGRTGLWVGELSRDGVREALLARRVFATREVGLRLDARLGGRRPGTTTATPGPADLAVDLACPGYDGREVEVQLLTGAGGEVIVLDRHVLVCGQVGRWTVEVPSTAAWLILRVADPARPYGSPYQPEPPGHPCATWALAYASPWYLDR